MTDQKKLFLSFHGRIIDSLGIQMYQSPVAAIAELVANSWDADATKVEVKLPETLSNDATIAVSDDGFGMTFEQCQKHYLNVGRNRRTDDDSDKSRDGRPVLGARELGNLQVLALPRFLRSIQPVGSLEREPSFHWT